MSSCKDAGKTNLPPSRGWTAWGVRKAEEKFKNLGHIVFNLFCDVLISGTICLQI